jgi:hypothetical protein
MRHLFFSLFHVHNVGGREDFDSLRLYTPRYFTYIYPIIAWLNNGFNEATLTFPFAVPSRPYDFDLSHIFYTSRIQ